VLSADDLRDVAREFDLNRAAQEERGDERAAGCFAIAAMVVYALAAKAEESEELEAA